MKPTKPKSKHLDIPEESNRDKHINFLAQERGEIDPGADEYGELFEEDETEEDKGKDEE
jgi:hypothetical protein